MQFHSLYLRHHVVLKRHGDDVESDDASNGQVKELAADDVEDEATNWRVVRVVRLESHL